MPWPTGVLNIGLVVLWILAYWSSGSWLTDLLDPGQGHLKMAAAIQHEFFFYNRSALGDFYVDRMLPFLLRLY